MAEVLTFELVREGFRPLPRHLCKHSQKEPWPWLKPPKHLSWGWTLAIAKIDLGVFLEVEKKQKGAASSSQVPSLF